MPALMPRLVALLLAFYAGALPHATAQEPIYQWTDETGQTVYSDQPPPSGRPAEKLQMPAAPSAEDVEAARQRSEALKQQADELAEERRLREQRAAEAAQRTSPPVQAEDPAEQADDYGRYPYYGTPPGNPDRRPILRPGSPPTRPTHPIARPGLHR